MDCHSDGDVVDEDGSPGVVVAADEDNSGPAKEGSVGLPPDDAGEGGDCDDDDGPALPDALPDISVVKDMPCESSSAKS